jgi:photosystem II stability/assembly factor-like uncharacterized protein
MNIAIFLRSPAVFTRLLAIGLATLGVTVSGAAGAEDKSDWVELDRRGFNAIWVARDSGDIFSSNGKTIHISRDAGMTWSEPVTPSKMGRHWNSISFDGAWQGRGLALFPIENPYSWLTLDGGKTWRTFRKPVSPQVKNHHGWTFGQVDWSAEEPERFFCKEHDSNDYWFSGDGGATWSRLEGFGGYFGMGIGADGALLFSTSEGKNPTIPGDCEHGIYRSEDDGRTWQCVFEGVFRQKVRAHRIDRVLYWPAKEGLAVSRDGGRSWSVMDGSPKDAVFGPFFGETDQEMLLVSEEGLLRTGDHGVTWTRLLAKTELPGPIRYSNFGELKPCFAWDWRRDVVYATTVEAPLFKREFKKLSD